MPFGARVWLCANFIFTQASRCDRRGSAACRSNYDTVSRMERFTTSLFGRYGPRQRRRRFCERWGSQRSGPLSVCFRACFRRLIPTGFGVCFVGCRSSLCETNTGAPTQRRAYLSDLTHSQWAVIEPMVPEAPPGGRPRGAARARDCRGDPVSAARRLFKAAAAARFPPRGRPFTTTCAAGSARWICSVLVPVKGEIPPAVTGLH
jgi:hypothetical protein